MIKKYVHGNCFDTIDNEIYDYVYTGIPCYEDLSSYGVNFSNPKSYKIFLDLFLPRLKPKSGTVTIAFTGYRRHSSMVMPKEYYLYETMTDLGYILKDKKYFLKRETYNPYTHTLLTISTFQDPKIKGVFNLRKNRLFDTYGPDLWRDPEGFSEIMLDGELVKQNRIISRNCIENFTDPGQVVLDPFAGVATTCSVAAELGRGYIGFEIRKKIYECGVESLKESSKQPLKDFSEKPLIPPLPFE